MLTATPSFHIAKDKIVLNIDMCFFRSYLPFIMLKPMIAIVGGFCSASAYLLRNPTVLHKKKNLKFKCSHISHRGGAAENLENTMTAFQHAADLGTDMLEIDCHITKDGIAVVSHDDLLERTTGQSLKISETNYCDLPLMQSPLDVTFCKGTSVEGCDKSVPKLVEVFDRFPSTVVNIDIKIDNDKLIQEVSNLIIMYRREDITVWGNFSNKITSKCYKENPNVPLIIPFSQALTILVLYYTWLLPFYPIRESAFEMVMPKVFNDIGRKYFNSKPGRLFGNFLDYLIMNKKLIAHLNDRGIFTGLWVLNTEKDFQRAYDVGVQGVMTDYPTRLRRFLNDNPQYNKSSVE